MFKKIFMACAAALCLAACGNASGSAKEATDSDSTPKTDEMAQDTTTCKVEVKTNMGDFTLLLYNDTPKHRDNFLKLVQEHFYDSLLFHRVIDSFMVQAGDPDSKNAKPGQMLGSGSPDYTIPAEIVFPKHFHKRGALAAARMGDNVNPNRESSSSQFYVVTGKTFAPEEMKQMQMSMAFQSLAQEHMDQVRQMQQRGDQQGLMQLQEQLVAEAEKMVAEGKSPLTEEIIREYTTVGGAPHLDGQYTVFGEVISGMETIEKIEKAETDRSDRPLEDVRILSMKVLE